MNPTTQTIQVSHEAVSSQKGGKGVCVGGGVGFMYNMGMSRARAGTRMRDRVGAILANAKSIWPNAHNAPLS